MTLSFSLDIGQTRGLGNLAPNDIIEFESDFVDLDIFMVQSIEKDDDIPALLLQLWQFEGGYNHAFKNVMENDFGINTQVPYFSPTQQAAVIEEFISYRPKESGYSKKEELFFDVWAEDTSNEQNDQYPLPYEVKIRFENGTTATLILPTWTPLQRLPLDRVKTGTEVEVWTVKDITNIMKVNQL